VIIISAISLLIKLINLPLLIKKVPSIPSCHKSYNFPLMITFAGLPAKKRCTELGLSLATYKDRGTLMHLTAVQTAFEEANNLHKLKLIKTNNNQELLILVIKLRANTASTACHVLLIIEVKILNQPYVATITACKPYDTYNFILDYHFSDLQFIAHHSIRLI